MTDLLEHNQLLLAVHSIHRILNRQTDQQSLIQKVCERLAGVKIVGTVWIGLMGDENEIVFSCEAGYESDLAVVSSRISRVSSLPCSQNPTGAQTWVVGEPDSPCGKCPFRDYIGDSEVISGRMTPRTGSDCLICISIPNRISLDESVKSTLQELIEDIGIGLSNAREKANDANARRSHTLSPEMALTNDGIISIDPDGIIYLFNRGAERILRCCAKDAVGNSILRFCPEDQEDIHAGMIKEALLNKTVNRFETTLKSLDGTIVPVEISLSVHTDQDGHALGITGIVRDITERKEVEARLKESEKKYRMLFENAPIGIFRTDSKGRALLINQALARTLNLESPNQALWYTDLSKQHYIDPNRRTELIEQLKTYGYAENFQYQAKTADDQIKWLTMNARISKIMQDGSFTIEGFITDITEYKEMIDALKESESKFRSYIECAPHGVFVIDGKGRYLECNRAACRLVGVPREKILASSVGDLGAKGASSLLRKLLEEGAFDEEVTVRGKDQPEKILRLTATRLTEDSFLAFSEDITERKKSDRQRELLTSAVEQAVEMIIITDTSGIIQYINPASLKMTRYSKEEVLGNHLRMFRSEDHDESYYRGIWETLIRGEVWSGQMVSRRKDGSLLVQESFISPVRNAEGRIDNFVVVGRDISREVQLEQQLRQAEKMEAVGVLAGGISHDFNNILGGIIGYTEMARWEMKSESPVSQYLDGILEASERAKKLVSQILTFSRQGSNLKSSHFLKPIIEEAVQLLRASIPVSIDISCDLCEETRPVLADPTHIHEIVLNLCTNAVHAMGEKGCLRIGLWEERIESDLEGKLGTIFPGYYTVLSVSDTGHGMSESVLRRIFEPFFTTKQTGEGTGMGLAVVFGIVKNHKGNLIVKTAPQKGTVFELYLPKADPVSGPKEAQAGKEIKGGTERIMYVDDEQVMRDIVFDQLCRLGYSVSVYEDSLCALKEFRKAPGSFDLVITDQTMPEMSGFELSRNLMSIRDIPIILCTGYSKYVDEQDALDAGIKGFLQKPFRIRELDAAIRSALKHD